MAALHTPKPILAITMGDPAGIGPEIIVKALQLPKVWRVCRPLVIGSRTILEHTVQRLKTSLPVMLVAGHDSSTITRAFRRGRLPLFDPFSKPVRSVRLGRVSAQAGDMAVTCIQTAVRLAQARCVAGMVTSFLVFVSRASFLLCQTISLHTNQIPDFLTFFIPWASVVAEPCSRLRKLSGELFERGKGAMCGRP